MGYRRGKDGVQKGVKIRDRRGKDGVQKGYRRGTEGVQMEMKTWRSRGRGKRRRRGKRRKAFGAETNAERGGKVARRAIGEGGVHKVTT